MEKLKESSSDDTNILIGDDLIAFRMMNKSLDIDFCVGGSIMYIIEGKIGIGRLQQLLWRNLVPCGIEKITCFGASHTPR